MLRFHLVLNRLSETALSKGIYGRSDNKRIGEQRQITGSIYNDRRPKKLFIRIPTLQDKKLLRRLNRILSAYKGETPVTLCPQDLGKGVKFPCRCYANIALINQLKSVFGKDNVVLRLAKAS